MQRVRQASSDSKLAASSRVALALLFSATLHVFLVFGIAWQTPAGSVPRVRLLHARLVTPESPPPDREPPVRRRLSVVRERQQASLPQRPVLDPLAQGNPEPLRATGSSAVAPIPAHEPRREPVQQEVRSPVPDSAVAMPDLAFHPAADLDVYPVPLSRIAPSYAEAANGARVTGSVRLMLLLDEFGRVTEATVLESRPEGLFDTAARQACLDATFSPAAIGGRPVRSRLVIQVDFDAEGAGEE